MLGMGRFRVQSARAPSYASKEIVFPDIATCRDRQQS